MVRLFAAFNGATFTQCVQLFVNIYRQPLGTCGIYYVVSVHIDRYWYIFHIITSAKEVMFSSLFVCLSACPSGQRDCFPDSMLLGDKESLTALQL